MANYTTTHLKAVFRPKGARLGEDQALLRKQVLHQIRQEPGSFAMHTWDTEVMDDLSRAVNGCGTTRCLCGWALFLSSCPVLPVEDPNSVEARGVAALGFTRSEYLGSFGTPLFFLGDERALACFTYLTENPL